MAYVLWIVGGILVVFVTFFLVGFIGGPAQLIFGRDGYQPEFFLKFTFWVSLVSAGILVGLYFSTLHKLQADYDHHKKIQQETVTDAVAPIVEKPVNSAQSERQWRIAEYERRGFRKTKTLQFLRSTPGGSQEVVLADLFLGLPPKTPEKGNIWFQRAALVYAGGQVVDLKAAVLYGDESWKSLSAEYVSQKRRGRPVHIENAINRPLIKTSLAQSHYAICLGLSSAETTQPSNLNEELSEDRAANLCRAIINLEFKRTEDVFGVDLGVARTKQTDLELQSKQRAVVVIGVDVFGEDLHMAELIRAASEVIQLNGLVIDDYSRSRSGYVVMNRLDGGEYVGAPKDDAIGDDDELLFYLKGRDGLPEN